MKTLLAGFLIATPAALFRFCGLRADSTLTLTNIGIRVSSNVVTSWSPILEHPLHYRANIVLLNGVHCLSIYTFIRLRVKVTA